MSARQKASPAEVDELTALATSLNDQLERLELLTAGEVDTIVDSRGRTFQLRRAQNELRQREAVRQAAILDALPAQVALLDGDGVIASANRSWWEHAVTGEAHWPGHAIGTDYVALCERAAGNGAAESRQVAAGLRSVMAGRVAEFTLEYCRRAPGPERWHQVTVTPLPDRSTHGAVVMHSDITERKQAQAALDELSTRTRKRERILSTTLAAIVDFAYIFDRNGRFLFANRALSDLLGLEEGALAGRNFIELGYPPDLAASLQRQIDDVFASGCRTTNVTSFVGASGEAGMYEYIFSPVVAADGSVEYVAGSTRDISAHHRIKMENTALIGALQESRDRLALATEAAGMGIWDWDVKANRMHWDPRMLELYGIRELDFGGAVEAWEAGLHPQDRVQAVAALDAALDGAKDFDAVFRVAWPTGEVRHIQGHAVIERAADGSAARMIGVNFDITQRMHDEEQRERNEIALREAERFSRATIDALSKSLCVLDETGTIIRINRQWRDFAAANGGDAAILGEGANYLAACDTGDGSAPSEGPDFAAGIRSVIAGERSQFAMEYSCDSPTARAWFLGRVSRFRGQGPTRVVVTHENITARKEAELALEQLNEELEAKVEARTHAFELARDEAEVASRAKSEFLATMSHEIRTPMNGVVGMIDVLQQSSLRGDQSEMVDLIRESAFSLLGVINDILDFSKVEAGKLELECEPFALESVVDGVGTLLNGMALKQDVTLTLFVDPAIPAQVAGDALRLRQVLTNLVSNAIKFSSGQVRPGRVSVRALLFERKPGQLVVEIEVTDNGVGMDADVCGRLFTAFSQADASTTRRFGGTGLGLAIAHHLVTLMGGAVAVRSAVGEGASFRIRVPFGLLPEPATVEVPLSEVAGLSCVVVGAAGGLADDMGAYLVAAGARVEREATLAGARQRQAGRNGLSVWVVDASDEREGDASTLAAARADRDVRFVVVLVERGRRSRPRTVAADTLMIDRNAMSRRSFLRAVAVAAGRASLDTSVIVPSSSNTTPRAPTREVALRERRLILVAEDNDNNRQVIVRQLALLGYAADVVADGCEALERWNTTDYALLLTDLHMPRMDGYDLTGAIRAREPDGTRKPIIALTANALKGEGERCKALGMDDYRTKPAPLSELKAVLEKWMPRPAQADAPHASIGAAAETRARPVDVEVLRALVGDDPQAVSEVLASFRLNAATMAQELRVACAHGSIADAAAAAHKLKPAARAIGAFALADLCAAIESEGRANNGEEVAALLSRFDAEMTAVDAFLDDA